MTRLLRLLRWIFVAAVVLVTLSVLALVGLGFHTRMYQTQDRRVVAPGGGEFVDAADTQILVQRAGSHAAPAVLFVHGTGSWSELWRPSMERVAELGLQAIAIDLPPFGYSMLPASGEYGKPAQAKRILGVLDALGIRQAVFVGHSFGSGPLMEAAFMAPERVRGIVLVDAALGLQSPVATEPSLAQRIAQNRWFSETVSAGVLTNPIFTKTLLQAFISDKDKATESWLAIYRRPLYVTNAAEGVAAWLPQLLAGRGTANSDDPARYAALRVPVTLIWGETDTITPLAQAEHLQQLIPGSALLRLPRAGHIPQVESPDAYAAALAQAVARR